jgi:hypothetical protein
MTEMAMAVIRINFVKKGTHERTIAKANVKYIQHRAGRTAAPQLDIVAAQQPAPAERQAASDTGNGNERISRALFGPGGEMRRMQAYRMIDEAEEGSTFFRIKICPDPEKEDKDHDLLLREITATTMDLAETLGKPIKWVAAIHDDHTDKTHVHVLAVTKARLLPAVLMRQSATEAIRAQRRELDAARERASGQERQSHERGKEAVPWERERSR